MEKLKGNVGRRPHRHCMNHVADQLTVQMLLNAIPQHLGGTGGTLDIKPIGGTCPDVLYKAIFKFQRVSVFSITADGIVEPTGTTLLFLNRLADQHFPATTPQHNDRVLDVRIQAQLDRWKDHPEELSRLKKKQSEEAITKWHNWKNRLRRDGAGNPNVQSAIWFLDDIEKTFKDGEPSINGWAVGFGAAYVASGFGSSWEFKGMIGEQLAYSFEKKNVRVTNLGLKNSFPVILFASQSHHIFKKIEHIVVDEP